MTYHIRQDVTVISISGQALVLKGEWSYWSVVHKEGREFTLVLYM